MNTKTDGISSGLIAVAWLSTDCIGERYLCFSKPRDNDPCETLVRLSDAEKLIAEKDVEIARLSSQSSGLARAVMNDQVSNDSPSLFMAAIRDLAAINEALDLDPDDGGAVPIIDAIVELREEVERLKTELAKHQHVMNPSERLFLKLRGKVERLTRERGLEHDTANRFMWENNALREQVATLTAALEWQPIETAPKDGTAILVIIEGSDVPHPVRFNNGSWKMVWDGYRIKMYDGPLCWMHCPPIEKGNVK